MKKSEKDKLNEVVALSYDRSTSDAPRVVAKGKGYVADEILQRAKESDIPIQEDASLVELLGKLNINEQIPDELYGAVAEIFAFIYRVDKRAAGK